MHEHHHKQRRDWRGAAAGLALALVAFGGIFNYAIRHQPHLVVVTELVPDDQIPHNGPEPISPPTVLPPDEPTPCGTPGCHARKMPAVPHPCPAWGCGVHPHIKPLPHHRAPRAPLAPHHRPHHHHWVVRPRTPDAPVCVQPILCN